MSRIPSPCCEGYTGLGDCLNFEAKPHWLESGKTVLAEDRPSMKRVGRTDCRD